MTFENEEQAIEALVAEANAESTPSISFDPPSKPETSAEGEQGATVEDSNNATPEEQRLDGLRLEDYTRKTQEIAPLRRFMTDNQIADLAAVQQAWDLASQLQSNPLDLYQQLGATLQQHGLIQPGGAPQQQQFQSYEQPDEFESEVALPPHVQAQLAQVNQIPALQQAINDMKAQADFAAWQYEQGRQERLVRDMNPTYKEEDMNFVHALSNATGGHIEDANNLYQQILQHALGQRIASKSGVPNAVTPPRTLGHATVPLDPATMSVDDAHRAAMELLGQLD